MIIRVPLIPGFNNDLNNIRSLGRFIKEELEGVNQIDIMPYHSMGESKITALGGTYLYTEGRDITEEEEKEVRDILESFELTVTIGG